MEIQIESMPAASRMIISGSLNFERNCSNKEAFFGGVKRLLPNSMRLFNTCSSLSPVSIIFELSISDKCNQKSLQIKLEHYKNK